MIENDHHVAIHEKNYSLMIFMNKNSILIIHTTVSETIFTFFTHIYI